MALDDMSSGTLLRQCIHELAAAYEATCAEYGDDSRQALSVQDAIAFMRGWMKRYSASLEEMKTPIDHPRHGSGGQGPSEPSSR
jgi:hypothetical protein